jgi:NADPH:quinone reductase-like Zn-dependent oxidoreductase
MPTTLTFAQAGTVPIVGGTSLQCLQCLPASNTDCSRGSPSRPSSGASPLPLANLTVVITSGSGGTGYLAIQMAKALGAARVITAATGAGPMAWVRACGADVVVDYMLHDIFDGLAPDTVDAVFDNYGGNGTADRAMASLKAGGTYLLLPHGNGQGALSKHPKVGGVEACGENTSLMCSIGYGVRNTMFSSQH